MSQIVSNVVVGAAAGTGARTVVISGVNSSYAVQTETVTLNGATPVALVNSYMTINSITVATAGSGGTTAGNLTLAAGGVTHGYVLAGRNRSTSFIYAIPASYGLLMYDFFVSEEAASAGGNRAQIVYSTNGGLSQPTAIFSTPTNLPFYKQFPVPLYFPEKTQLQAQFLSAAATAVVTASASCILLNRSAESFSKWI